jgi:ribonuclease Z
LSGHTPERPSAPAPASGPRAIGWPERFAAGALTVDGFSLGGVETAVHVPELKLAIDVGRGGAPLVRCDHLALTHTHMDHAGGVPYLLALRQLYGMRAPTLYVPAQMAEALATMLRSWEAVQRYSILCPLVPVEPGERYPIARDVWLEPFRTYHPVPSNGYLVVREKKKLKPEHLGRPGTELAELKRRGEVIEEVVRDKVLAVTGDTLVEVLDKQPHILEAETLMIECTFLDDRKSLADSRAGGHVHLSELMPLAGAFHGKRLVLSHFSQLYDEAEVPALLEAFRDASGAAVYAFPMSPRRAAGHGADRAR